MLWNWHIWSAKQITLLLLYHVYCYLHKIYLIIGITMDESYIFKEEITYSYTPSSIYGSTWYLFVLTVRKSQSHLGLFYRFGFNRNLFNLGKMYNNCLYKFKFSNRLHKGIVCWIQSSRHGFSYWSLMQLLLKFVVKLIM